MKKKTTLYGSPANAPLTFQALQAADFPLKNRAKLTRSLSHNQDQAGGGRQSGGAGAHDAESPDGAGVNNTRIFVNSSVPASLFTATATSTQLPDREHPSTTAAALLPADMGMLRPTAAQRLPQHGLPSGTHIRRRPRSVARHGAGAHAARQPPLGVSGTAAAGGGGSSPAAFGSPQQVFIAPPSKGLAQGGSELPADNLARSQFMSPELLSLSPAPVSEDGAAPANAAATTAGGLKAPATGSRPGRDVKPLKYVRRAAPSPAPSRPARASRRRQIPAAATPLTAVNKSGSPTDHALGMTGSWADADMAGSRQSATGTAPFTRFARAGSGHADADHVVLGDSREHSLSGHPGQAEPRPRSARRLAALTDAPTAPAPTRASETLDFYLKLCAEVGEEPSAEWVRALEDAAASGPTNTTATRKTRKEVDSKVTPTAGPSRRAKSPGTGAKTAVKRSSSSGVGGRAVGGAAAAATATTAPGGGQRPPLTRKSTNVVATAAAAAGSIEDEIRLYCKSHLYPCLQKIGTIEKYRQSLSEALSDFKQACGELPPNEAAAKALLAAEPAAPSLHQTSGTVVRRGSAIPSGRSTGGVATTTSASTSPPQENLIAAAGSQAETPSHLARLASRLSHSLAKLQDGATSLLLTLAKYSKEARRPIGSVGADVSHETLNAPQGFVKRLAKEEVKTARLLESIRAEVEAAFTSTPCVQVEDVSLFQTPLLYSSSAAHAPAALSGGRTRAQGESGRALTLSHRSGAPSGSLHTPRGGLSASAGSGPETGALSPSPLGTRRHSTTASGRHGLVRGSAGAAVSAGRPTLAPVVKLALPTSSRTSPPAGATSSSRRSSVHSESGSTVLFVVTSHTTPPAAPGTFSRRGSGDSLSSAASQTPSTNHATAAAAGTAAGAARADRGSAPKGGAGRSRSASAGAGKRRGGATTAAKRSGSVKAGVARAATGGGTPSTSTSAVSALPLRHSLRGSVDLGDNEVGSTLTSARVHGPSLEDLEEAKTVWDAVSALARQSSRRSAGSSRSPARAGSLSGESQRKPSDASTVSSKTPNQTSAATATAAPSPDVGTKARPASAELFVNALAVFDQSAKPPRASSEAATAPDRGAPLLQSSPGSAALTCENTMPPCTAADSGISPYDAPQLPPHRPLYGIDSRSSSGGHSALNSPEAGHLRDGEPESPVVESVSDDALVTSNLSHTMAVTATATTAASSPPSSERLKQARSAIAASQRRGRSQSVLQVAPASEKDIVAVKLIMAYYRRFKARKQLATRLAQHRKDEEAEAAAQQRRVSECRVARFLWSVICRRRTRKAVAADRRAKQLQAVAAAAEAATHDAVAQSAASKASAGKALTSRERLQLAKAQREAMRTDGSAATTTTTTPIAAPVASSATARLVATPSSAARTEVAVPNLPLVENGITTNIIANYNRDSDGFEVAVLHRLLLAPKALLYAVRSAVDAYPTRPPMAYARAVEDIRRGDASVSPERASQTPERDDTERLSTGHHHSKHIAVDVAQEAKDRRDGVVRLPFSVIRPHILYYAELAAQASSSAGTDTTTPAQESTSRHSAVSAKQPRVGAASPSSSSSSPAVTLRVPRSVRYDSYVDVDELRHDKPVVKPFPRPFEVWGSAHSLVRRIFSAAAMYAWKLIFSHTPHDDYKQRQLRARDEQAARLERVDQRNRMILACYAVHSEREWLREASKDLSFVGQIFSPKGSMDPNDPDLDRHCRETYEFVEDFLYQCFPTVSSLDEVPSFLVGAGLFFVLKEVFQWRADAPDSVSVLKQVPGWVMTSSQLTAPRDAVQSQRDQFLEAHPNVAMFRGSNNAKHDDGGDGLFVGANATQSDRYRAQPVDVYLTGFQHFELMRYEQLSLLQRIAQWIYAQRPAAEPKVSNVFSPLSPQQSMEVTTSLTQSAGAAAAAQFLSRRTDDSGSAFAATFTTDADGLSGCNDALSGATSPVPAVLKPGKGDAGRRASDTTTVDELQLLHSSVSGASLMHDRLADSMRAGSGFVTSVLGEGTSRHQKQLTPAERRQDAEEAKKEQPSQPVKLVVVPASAVQMVKQQQSPSQPQGRSGPTSASSTPSRGSAVGPERKPGCDFEHEQFIKLRQHKVSLVLARYLEGVGPAKPTRGDRASKKATAASSVETDKPSVTGSEFVMVYPKNFLVNLSETLTYELLGLRLHLGVCEELDAV